LSYTLALPAQVNLVEPHFAFEPGLEYDASVPSPESFLGYRLGEAFTLYAHAEAYLKKLAEASGRVAIGTYGETYEGRRLYRLAITSAANQARLEELRQQNLRLAGPDSLSRGEAEALIRSLPVLISFSYNIHGNEPSSTEAAMQVAYRLAAATDEATEKLLSECIVIMYPCINPDGRDRYVYWYQGMRRNVIGKEPRDLEHYAPWPNGRTNHYWFDINRDWVWGVHPESRGHTQEYQRWMPHLHADYHEMGYNNNYFTMPGTTPRNKLLPDAYEPLTDTIGRANAAAFDQNKIAYFTREAYDFFYPSYGSSYPSVMGAVGMLTEQGGIAGGLAVETDDEYVLTFRQRIFDHYITSMATIRKAAERKEQFIRYSYEAHQPANSKSSTKAYILKNNGKPYLPEVLRILLHHGVQVGQAEAGFTLAATDYRQGKTEAIAFDKGDYIISANQPRHLLIHSILARNLAIEDSVMYDMATWAAPLAYNLEAYATEQGLKVKTKAVEAAGLSQGVLINGGAQYAYAIEWKQRYAPRALAKLWEKGYRVRSVRKTFTNGDHSFGPGSLVILLGRNREKLATVQEDMQAIARAAGVTIIGLGSGRSKEGIDLASRDSRPLRQPKVALLVEEPFSTYTCGQIYFLFDQETELPVERVRTSILQQTALPKFGSRYGYADLKDYDVLILADGGKHLDKLFTPEYQKALKEWIEAGGTLVATESAAEFFTKEKSKIVEVELVETPKDTTKAGAFVRYEEREDYKGKQNIPGSALLGHIDHSNPLAFGLESQLYTLKFGNSALKANPRLETVGYYAQDASRLLVAGYASEVSLKLLAGNAFAAVQPLEKGRIVYLLDNTQFRMFWRGPSRLMQNAVMLLPGM